MESYATVMACASLYGTKNAKIVALPRYSFGVDNSTYANEAMADVIVAAYKGQRLTQPDLAVMTGISPRTLQRLLSGHSDIDVERLFLIGEALGVSATDLMTRAQERIEQLAKRDQSARSGGASIGKSEVQGRNVTSIRNRNSDLTAADIDAERELHAAHPADPEADEDEQPET